MKKIIGLVLGVTVSLIFVSTGLIFSQEPPIQGGSVPETQTEPEIEWVWGEVVSSDAQNKTILIKYLDYETDQEKETTINIDDKTTYENIGSLEEIQPKDVLSIDYIVDLEGKNIARKISIEKPESIQPKQEENKIQENKVEENKTPVAATEEGTEAIPPEQ